MPLLITIRSLPHWPAAILHGWVNTSSPPRAAMAGKCDASGIRHANSQRGLSRNRHHHGALNRGGFLTISTDTRLVRSTMPRSLATIGRTGPE